MIYKPWESTKGRNLHSEYNSCKDKSQQLADDYF